MLYADRTPKLPLEVIYAATRGTRTERELQIEREWQARMLKFQQDQGMIEDDADEPTFGNS